MIEPWSTIKPYFWGQITLGMFYPPLIMLSLNILPSAILKVRTLSLISSSQTRLSYDYFLNSTEIVNLTSFKFYNFYWWTKDHSFIYSPFFNYPICVLVLVCHKGLYWPVLLPHNFSQTTQAPHSNQVAAELGQPGY